MLTCNNISENLDEVIITEDGARGDNQVDDSYICTTSFEVRRLCIFVCDVKLIGKQVLHNVRTIWYKYK